MNSSISVVDFAKDLYVEIGYVESEEMFYVNLDGKNIENNLSGKEKPFLISQFSFKVITNDYYTIPITKITIEYKFADFDPKEKISRSNLSWATIDKKTFDNLDKISEFFHLSVGKMLDQAIDTLIIESGMNIRLSFIKKLELYRCILDSYLKLIYKPIEKTLTDCKSSNVIPKVLH